jgi:hypothetical protein
LFGGIAVSVTAMLTTIAVPSGFGAKGWAAGVVASLVLAGLTLLLLGFAGLKNSEAQDKEFKAERARLRAQMERLRRPGDFGRPVEPPPKPEPPWGPEALRAVKIVYQSALILASIFFGWFLWGVARGLGRSGLAAATLAYVITCSGIGVGVFVLGILAEKSVFLEKYFIGGWVWGWLGVTVVFGVWSLVEIFLVRSAITGALVRRGS